MINDVYINKHLKAMFGEQEGQANFRLVYTKNLMEYRKVLVEPEVAGIKLPPYSQVQYRPKYQYLPRDYWVIERLFRVEGTNRELLPGVDFSYEPIYVFKRPDSDEAIQFGEDAVMALVHVYVFRRKKPLDKAQLDEMELKEYERQVDYLTQFLQDECSPIATQLHFGEAVTVS
jgi:hypothetical protein